MTSTTILPKEQYSILYKASYMALAASLYGVYRQHYHVAIVPASIFLTSINYWRHPDYSWRLQLDLAVVRTMVAYQHLMAWRMEQAIPYYVCAALMIVFYMFGHHNFNKKNYWAFTYFHFMVHLSGNIGNVVLYSSTM